MLYEASAKKRPKVIMPGESFELSSRYGEDGYSINKQVIEWFKQIVAPSITSKIDDNSAGTFVYANKLSHILKDIPGQDTLLLRSSYFGCEARRLGFAELRRAEQAIVTQSLMHYPKYMRKPSIVRLAAKHPRILPLHSILYKMGCKDINIRNNVVSLILKHEEQSDTSHQGNISRDMIFCSTSKIKKFFKEYLKGKNANGIYRALIETYGTGNLYDLIDAAKAYTTLKENNIKTNIKGSIQDVHNRLTADVTKLSSKNVDIPYSGKEKRLEGTYNNYTFTLPKDTWSLIDIGGAMNICVGSYGDMAVKKSCTIVTAKDTSNNYAVCIELRGRKVRQAKTNYNFFPQGEAKKAVIDWIAANELQIETYDIAV